MDVAGCPKGGPCSSALIWVDKDWAILQKGTQEKNSLSPRTRQFIERSALDPMIDLQLNSHFPLI